MKELQTGVLIVGAGPAGISAAAAAARMGVPVTITEKENCPGGLMRSAFPGSVRNLSSCAGQTALQAQSVSAFDRSLFTRETLSGWMKEFLADENITVLTDTKIARLKIRGGRILRADAATRQGKLEIFPHTVIDAAGNGTIAEFAGVKMIPGRSDDGLAEAPVIRAAFRGADVRTFLREGMGNHQLDDKKFTSLEAEISYYGEIRVTLHAAKRLGGDRTVEEESRLQMGFDDDLAYAAELVKDTVPGMKDAMLAYAAPGYLFPESSHPVGCHVLEEEELRKNPVFEDWAVGRMIASYGEGNEYRFSLPYGSLITQEIKNLLLCGRSISMSHEAAKIVTGIPAAMATGQAAGCAAALCVMADLSVRRIEPLLLQDCLIRMGMAGPEKQTEEK